MSKLFNSKIGIGVRAGASRCMDCLGEPPRGMKNVSWVFLFVRLTSALLTIAHHINFNGKTDFGQSVLVMLFCICVHVHSRVHVLRSTAPHSPHTLPPFHSTIGVFVFLPLEISRQDFPHAAENGLMLPRTLQVELKAAHAAALVARLLGFCGHG